MPRVKGTVSQEILRKLLIGGAFLVAAQSPYFWLSFYKSLFSGERVEFKERTVRDTFYYLKRRNLIVIEKKNKQIYIRLTEEGEKKAGRYQINKLKIKTPKRWDKKWRLIIFDIPEEKRIRRDAFRGKLKELGFYLLQKSVWIYPYPCQKEVKLLREFFNLTEKNLRMFEVNKLENDKFLKKIFKLT